MNMRVSDYTSVEKLSPSPSIQLALARDSYDVAMESLIVVPAEPSVRPNDESSITNIFIHLALCFGFAYV